MKKFFILLICVVAFATGSIAQSAMYLPVMLKNVDGSLETYDIKKGDKLVYQVSAFGSEYEFIVTVNSESSENGIDFDYIMTNNTNTKGHVTISAKAKSEATKYVNYFRGGELNLTDACTVWLSDKNFNNMSAKKTVMQLDNGSPETFYRPENDEVNPIVKIKGEDKKLDGFRINNGADGKGDKSLWINNISSNSLILKMELGWTILLKEIR